MLVPQVMAAQGTAHPAAGQKLPAAQNATQPVTAQIEERTEVTPKDEKEEMNVYRHAPIVQSIARMMHMKLETTARLFEMVNFIIIALLLVIPLLKILPRLIHGRRQGLRNKLESARSLTEDARSRLGLVEAKMAKLDEEIAAIRAHVEQESRQDEVRIKSTIEHESRRIVAAAEQEIEAAAAHAQRGLRSFAAELAIEKATQQLVMTPETDRALIAEFVRDAGRGGQN
ncbi:MAG TPA: ATP synthase F0 subunit B [Terracidiphilus sp.]|nr:ATP synthase F0 subunit B [Terracidiphilus sp.]